MIRNWSDELPRVALAGAVPARRRTVTGRLERRGFWVEQRFSAALKDVVSSGALAPAALNRQKDKGPA